MKTRGNSIIIGATAFIMLTYITLSVVGARENTEIEIEKINGKISQLGNVKVVAIAPYSDFKARKLIFNSNGNNEIEEIKYDRFYNVDEKVLNNKDLYRETMYPTTSFENSDVQIIGSGDWNEIDIAENLNSYTINIACKEKNSGKIERIKTDKKVYDMSLLKIQVVGNKTYLIAEEVEMSNDKMEPKLVVYNVDFKNKAIDEVKRYDVLENTRCIPSNNSVKNNKFYFLINHNADDYLGKKSTYKISIGCINLNTLELDTVDYDLFEVNDMELDSSVQYYIEGNKLYGISTVATNYNKIKSDYFFQFDLEKNKFDIVKELGINVNTTKKEEDIIDFKVEKNKMCLLLRKKYKEDDGNPIRQSECFVKVINMDTQKEVMMAKILPNSEYYYSIKLDKDLSKTKEKGA